MSRVQLGRWVKGDGQGQVGRGGGWLQPGERTVGEGTSVSSSIAWVSGTRNTDSSGFHSFSITQSPD